MNATGGPRFAALIDRFNRTTGHAVAWLTLLMVLLTVVIVVLRYVLDTGFIWLQEGLTWLHATTFMLGMGYALQQDAHVRVDIFYREMSERQRALVNGVGVLLFLFPVCGFVFSESLDYVRTAWTIGEVSRDAGGLPYPAIPLLKSMLLLMPALVALQGVGILLISLHTFKQK